MGDESDALELFFSSAGRLARTKFAVTAGMLLAIAVLYQAIAHSVLLYLTGWVVYPLLIFTGACLISKRMHDRGRSGWWAALVLTALVALWGHPSGFFAFLFLLILIWAAVELALMPGEQGSNRFGPNPLRPAAQ